MRRKTSNIKREGKPASMSFITSMTTTRIDVLHESTKNENIHEKNVQVTSKRAACKYNKNQEKLKNAKALRI